MKTLTTFKANGLGEQIVESVTIEFSKDLPVPPGRLWILATTRAEFALEASKIADAMLSVMPQGIVDYLLAELMRRKASVLHVPMVAPVTGLRPTDDEAAAEVAAIDADPEGGHKEADELLCELLCALGYQKTVAAYRSLSKWYA